MKNLELIGICCDFFSPIVCETNPYISADIFADKHRDGSVEFPSAFHKSQPRRNRQRCPEKWILRSTTAVVYFLISRRVILIHTLFTVFRAGRTDREVTR